MRCIRLPRKALIWPYATHWYWPPCCVNMSRARASTRAMPIYWPAGLRHGARISTAWPISPTLSCVCFPTAFRAWPVRVPPVWWRWHCCRRSNTTWRVAAWGWPSPPSSNPRRGVVMAKRDAQYDVAVVGGGMVGAVLAVALARADFAVALIEARRPPEFDPQTPYDLRQSAIAPAPMRLLANLELWDYVAARRACPFTGMKVWDAGSSAELFLEHTEIGVPELGHIVDNGLVVASAWRRLDAVDVFCPAKLAELTVDDQAATLTLDDGRRVRAALVVGAEGGNSFVRQAAGIATTGWGYGQRCTVGAITTERRHRHIAW